MQRRQFLHGAALSAVAAAFLDVGRDRVRAASRPAGSSTGLALLLDGKLLSLRGFSGADLSAQVVQNNAPLCLPQKHVSGLNYSELKLLLDLPPDPAIVSWIAALLGCQSELRNLSVLAFDLNRRETYRIDVRGYLTGATFPALQASAREIAGPLELTVSPESVRWPAPSNVSLELAPRSKALNAASFRLTVDGLDGNASRISALGPLSLRRPLVADALGQSREPTSTSSLLQISNLLVSVPMNSADAWRAWATDFLVNGNSADGQERSGTLELLGPDLRNVLFAIELEGLGPIKMTTDIGAANNEQLPLAQIELYVEGASLV